MSHVSGKFSAVIPTLQRSPGIAALVDQLAAHPLVHEILVVNNAPEPLQWESAKVRVLQQDHNIYVNPAWNLGASEARGEFLAIINDDVRFSNAVLDHAANVLGRGRYSMLGPSQSCLRPRRRERVRHRFGSLGTTPFGTLMMLRRSDYLPVPDDLLIWGGDHWLMLNQRRPIAKLVGVHLRTVMSSTSGAPEFQAMREAEEARVAALCAPLKLTRWWHWPASVLVRGRIVQNRLRASLWNRRGSAHTP